MGGERNSVRKDDEDIREWEEGETKERRGA